MSAIKTNHICKNINCTKGSDGGRKKYYACDYCGRTSNHRSVACCEECWKAYSDQVIEARTHNKKVDVLPDRLDMIKAEVKEMMKKPIEVVMEETKEELKEYIEKDETANFAKIVDEINAELDSKETSARPRKKRVPKNSNEK